MSEKLTPDTLRALVAHGKGTPAEYIVKRADIDAHADAWQAREEALRRLAQAQADVEALRRFADHWPSCGFYRWFADGHKGECNCGFTALPEHLRGASR